MYDAAHGVEPKHAIFHKPLQVDLQYEDFNNLIDPKTLVTVVRYVKPESDFHSLARFLETDVAERVD